MMHIGCTGLVGSMPPIHQARSETSEVENHGGSNVKGSMGNIGLPIAFCERRPVKTVVGCADHIQPKATPMSAQPSPSGWRCGVAEPAWHVQKVGMLARSMAPLRRPAGSCQTRLGKICAEISCCQSRLMCSWKCKGLNHIL